VLTYLNMSNGVLFKTYARLAPNKPSNYNMAQKPAHRVTDLDSTPEALSSGSPTVFTNLLRQGRVGDKYVSGAAITTGSSSVFVESKPLARVGDAVDDGATITTGSPTVFVG
jgi:uncharacterized Zn-binding protein involved in type VI secretion